ncbi:hypothetical protein [Poriferisphaera sp. WC338]|uniref:hypothetical protein n=1 Tax=Poriferisphaera sp. WC338 TaxID=3425129 RepID=UPI003D81396A
MSRAGKRSGLLFILVALVALCVLADSAISQNSQTTPAEGMQERVQRFREGRGRMSPEDMRARMMERMRDVLGFEEEEWELVLPFVEKVGELNQQLNPRRRSMRGRGGSEGRPQGDRSQEERPDGDVMREAADALREVVEKEDASPAEIQAVLEHYRETRALIESELAVAQRELKEVLTVKQEAQMVMFGMLK